MAKKTQYIVDDEGCWRWQLRINRDGYGHYTPTAGVTKKAHRYYWEQAKGPIPEGMTIDHLCGHRDCVNPDHMEMVSRMENVRRSAVAKLTHDDVAVIRKRLAEGDTRQSIADDFGVHRKSIDNIVNGRSWSGEESCSVDALQRRIRELTEENDRLRRKMARMTRALKAAHDFFNDDKLTEEGATLAVLSVDYLVDKALEEATDETPKA